MLINRDLTSITKDDTYNSLAHRIVHNMVNGLVAEFGSRGLTVSKSISEVQTWLSHRPSDAGGGGFGVTLGPFGGGQLQRSNKVPASVSDATAENWRDILESLVAECKAKLGLDGMLLCIDNTETLSIEELLKMLMFYRDTLFRIKHIWWVIVGGRNLYGQIARLDHRVAQRIQGDGIEIVPLSSAELHEMVQKRIQRLRANLNAQSPLSEQIHELLFQASCGQPRYMLQRADTLFGDIITEMRLRVMQQHRDQGGPPEFRGEMVNRSIKKLLVDNPISNAVATNMLIRSAIRNMQARNLPLTHLADLRNLGSPEAPSGATSPAGERVDNTLDPTILSDLEKADLVFRVEKKGRSEYVLKGDAWLCNRFNRWDDVMHQASRG